MTNTKVVPISYGDFDIMVYTISYIDGELLKKFTEQLEKLMNTWASVEDEQLFFRAIRLEFEEYLRERERQGLITLKPKYYPPHDHDIYWSYYTDTIADLFIDITGKSTIESTWDKDFNDILYKDEGPEVIY